MGSERRSHTPGSSRAAHASFQDDGQDDGATSLSDTECRRLLALARASIAAALCEGQAPESSAADIPAAARRDGACFVSLHTRDSGALRGCIGTFVDSLPLWQQIESMAVSAAMHDPRFAALRIDELAACDIEISVLTPSRAVTPDQVEVGRHGLWISHGSRSGVLLPQVASECGWDRPQFLSHTCLKAGLPPDAWRESGVTIEVFTAQVFSEHSLGVGVGADAL